MFPYAAVSLSVSVSSFRALQLPLGANRNGPNGTMLKEIYVWTWLADLDPSSITAATIDAVTAPLSAHVPQCVASLFFAVGRMCRKDQTSVPWRIQTEISHNVKAAHLT